ncbi:MAG: hypothetical protein P8R42_13815 [Candidatus Binatia bacterium]|nr:hypothetical protein [Candidatus Binatia bacterium]
MKLLRYRSLVVPMALVALFTLAACGSDGSSTTNSSDPGPTEPGPTDPEPTDPEPTDPEPTDPSAPAECDGVAFDSTFDAVQQVVFDGYDCNNLTCHGSDTASGGLDLTAGNSWTSLHDVPSVISADLRVAPGSAVRSLLYQKLAAATLGEDAVGSPMPIGREALSENDLNLVRWWIYGGAPETGVVLDAAEFVPGCLPEAEPISIKPLDAPAAGEGIQIEMPSFRLPPGLEVERCFATYFNVCDQVPAELLERNEDLGVDFFPFDSRELRMDPGSHHMILNYSIVDPDLWEDPSWGGFACSIGADEGKACDPRDSSACSEGHCVSKFREGFTCGGYGPSVPGARRSFFPIGGAQRAQDFRQYPEGVFNQIPCEGMLFWNPHAFNLTVGEQTTNARLNYYFADADNMVYANQGGLTGPIFIADNAPFTTETYCSDFTLPQGGRVYELSSHTHKHGEYFTIEAPDGSLLYENFVYNDPHVELFDPPLEFDSEDPAERRLHFCSTYNNGVNDDGTPNVDAVTRASRVPQSARVPGSFGTCVPVACVNPGMIGEACNGEDDDASCDSSPGAGDGECDACHITGGESTENEMFLMLPAYFVVPVE